MSERRRYVCGHRLPAAEADVLELLLANGEPISVAEVQETLPPPRRAYTTVSTLLTRLAERGLVVRHARGRVFEWSPAGSSRDLAVAALERVLDRIEDPDAVLLGFLESVKRKRRPLSRSPKI